MSQSEQQRLKRQFHQHAKKANEQNLTLNQVLANVGRDVNDLFQIANDMRGALAEVGNFAVFFDMKSLQSEGVMDLTKIDANYMLTIGRQLITDYQQFTIRANAIAQNIANIKAKYDLVRAEPSYENLTQLAVEATQSQQEYVEWGESFSRILVNAMHDIANHLNPLRPSDRQIIINL